MSDPIQQYVDQARQLIATHGWAVQHVPGNRQQPPFTYTIGLVTTHGHPEMLVTGLPDEIAAKIVNEVGVRIAGGATFAAHGRYGGILASYDVVMLPIPDAHKRDELILARRLYPEMVFDALQIVWPDAEGRFPWEDDSTADASGQVLVGTSPPSGAR